MLRKLLKGTRSEIVQELRKTERTVHELADEFKLTPNAIRAQLSKLERDDLVEIVERRPTGHKPENVYGLTKEARHLFPSGYDALLTTLIAVHLEREGQEATQDLLEAVGKRVAHENRPFRLSDDPEERLKVAAEVFVEMGGMPEMEKLNGIYKVTGPRCPFSAVTKNHPHVCDMARAFIEEITGYEVKRECDLNRDIPKCIFHVDTESSTENQHT